MSVQNIQGNRHSGFSLIEMMIAMTIGLMIVAALTAVVISSARSSKANDRTSELQSNGRYALDVVKRDVQVAGYYGLSGRGVDQKFMNLPNDCFTGFATNINQRVWGTDDGTNVFNGISPPGVPAAAPITCIPNANYAGSDILVLRYASLTSFPSNPNIAPPSDANGITGFANTGANSLFFRSAYEISRLYQTNALPTFTNQPQQDHIVQVHVYYISPWTVSANESPKIPSLRRLVLDNTGSMVDQLVASGIENMQVQYGIVDSSGNTTYLDAQNVNPSITTITDAITCPVDTTGASINNWGNVNVVRLWLLSRNSGSERGEAYVNNTQYTMGDVTNKQYNDNFRRQLFTTTIQLRN